MLAAKQLTLCSLPTDILWHIIDAGCLSVADLCETCSTLRHLLGSSMRRLSLSGSLTEAQVQAILAWSHGGL